MTLWIHPCRVVCKKPSTSCRCVSSSSRDGSPPKSSRVFVPRESPLVNRRKPQMPHSFCTEDVEAEKGFVNRFVNFWSATWQGGVYRRETRPTPGNVASSAFLLIDYG